MKKSLLLIALLLGLYGNSQTAPSFTITSVSGSNSITCLHPTLNYLASGASNLTYMWVSSSTTLSGSNVNINTPGAYTVTASDSLNFSSQVIIVAMNTLAPISSLSPTVATITCDLNSAVTFTGSSNVSNCTHYFSAPQGGTAIFYNNTSLYSPFAPGTYTYILEDNSNGCKTIKTFAINSNTSHPTFSLVSPQNFTLGCSSKSVTVISIVNAQTTPTPGGALSYSMVFYASTVLINGNLSNVTNYTLAMPGLWTAVVRDNNNGCDSKIPFSVLQNTNTPNISVNVPQQVLDCYNPQITLKANSTTPNVSYNWMFIGTPGNHAGDSISVHTNTAAITNTILNTYTLSVTDNNNACKSNSIIPIYQNIFKPNALLSSGGNSILNASTPSIVLVNVSTTGIPPSLYPTGMPVIGFIICGPTIQYSVMNSSTFTASTPGTYTLIAKDLNNGCTSSTTLTIIDGMNLVNIQKSDSDNLRISLFPNPNNGQFTILANNEIGSKKLEIYNTLGTLVKSEFLTFEKTEVDLQNTSKGIYIIQITENGKTIYSTKFIKH